MIRTNQRLHCLAIAVCVMQLGFDFDANQNRSNSLFAQSPTAGNSSVARSGMVRASGPRVSISDSVGSTTFQLPPVDADVKQVVVTTMAVDPRGQFLAVAGDDHVIRILSAKDFRVVKTLGDGRKTSQPESTEQQEPIDRVGHFDWIRTLAFDRSGNRLVSAGNDGQVIIWDRRRDFEILQEIGSAPAISSVSFSPSGNQMAAVGFDSHVFLIGKNQSRIPRLNCSCVDLRCCRYRDDGAMLVVGGRDGHVHGFDPKTGQTVFEVKLHDGRVRDLVFQAESDILVSVGEDGGVTRYGTGDEKVLSQEKITSGRLFTVAMIDSERFATAGSDDEIHIVEIDDDGQSLNVRQRLRGHVGSISKLSMVNGALVSGGFDATLRRWNLDESSAAERKIARGQSGNTDDETTPR